MGEKEEMDKIINEAASLVDESEVKERFVDAYDKCKA
jgi:hypothetical protein